MKKVALAFAFILTVSAGFSQQRKRIAKANNITAEQQATLTAKKLTLQLELSKEQTKKIIALYTEVAKQRKAQGTQMKKEREASVKNNKEQARKQRRPRPNFETANTRLDQRIEFKVQMKKILTPEQFEKFTKLQKRKVGVAKKRMAGKKQQMIKNKKMRKRSKGKF
ncbi:MAG: hypothetical protein P8H13_05595 [Polaribacter sp.]|nr:hypothetical protein [Polaribacter sp.]MDG1811391.1 hypothetical protein [Polaribacter sp.]MDG1994361.1 hypothetical protein [Polaribacter sp.]